MRVHLFPVLGLLAMAGCGTPEFRAERSICAAEWMQKVPPKYENQIVERTRRVRVPTGPLICEGQGKRRHCERDTEVREITYNAIERVDVRKLERDIKIRECVQAACTAKFGNPQCKVPTTTVATPPATP